jgi:protein-disulfide isomerase
MNRALPFLALLLTFTAEAQLRDNTAVLKRYAAQVLPKCPDGVLTLEPGKPGPANFNVYLVTIRSSDKYCGSQKYLLHSPKTHQVLIGTVFQIDAGPQPIAARVSEHGSKLIGAKVTAQISPFPLPDGLKTLALSRQTEFGPFTYRGYLDEAERFMIVGFRGSLKTDPAKTLREALGTSNAVRRGSASGVEIIELSDFQCPTCANAHEKVEPFVRKHLSKINYLRLDLPLFEHHQWAVPAALAARAISRVAPQKYWAYVDHVFEHQENIGKRPFAETLREFVQDHEIDWNAVKAIYESKEERAKILDQVSRAFAAGVASTPTYIVNGQIMGFGPDGKFTIDAIESAVGGK